MLRLYIDANEGAYIIPCPRCERPLLLGARKMGRWVVGYDGGFPISKHGNPMLVCGDLDCEYMEPVQLATRPADAVAYNPHGAASFFLGDDSCYRKTLGELERKVQDLSQLYKQTRNPKLPSLIRYWYRHGCFTYWNIKHTVKRVGERQATVSCDLKDKSVKGTIIEALPSSLILECESGETMLLQFQDLKGVCEYSHWDTEPKRFDFSDGGRQLAPGNTTYRTPTHYAVINGYTVEVETFTDYGICRVRTGDAKAAEALALRCQMRGDWFGEFPAVLVESYYKLLRYCHIMGFRLMVHSFTKDPNVFQLETKEMEAARALKMSRPAIIWFGRHDRLEWIDFFHRNEVERWEEVRIPMRVPRPVSLKRAGTAKR